MMERSNGWGGRRKEAGAPAKSVHKDTKSRGIRMTDSEYEKVKKFLNDLREEEKKMKKAINALFDACLDTSNDSYSDILAAFNGVKATEENKEIFGKVIRKCLEDYNEAYTDTGLENADLNSEVGEKAIKEKIDSLDDSIDTTKSGIKYYRLGNWPTHDDEIKEKPADKGDYMNDYYACNI